MTNTFRIIGNDVNEMIKYAISEAKKHNHNSIQMHIDFVEKIVRKLDEYDKTIKRITSRQ